MEAQKYSIYKRYVYMCKRLPLNSELWLYYTLTTSMEIK